MFRWTCSIKFADDVVVAVVAEVVVVVAVVVVVDIDVVARFFSEVLIKKHCYGSSDAAPFSVFKMTAKH